MKKPFLLFFCLFFFFLLTSKIKCKASCYTLTTTVKCDSILLAEKKNNTDPSYTTYSTQHTSKYSFGGSFGYAYHFNRCKEGTYLIKKHELEYYSAYLNYRSLEKDSSVYDMAFGLPTLEFGFLLARCNSISIQGNKNDIHYKSHLGNQYTFYYGFRRDVLSGNKLDMGYALENGLGITTTHYNKYNNVDNLFIGSVFSIYFGASLYGKYRFSSHWEAILELGFKHYSNSGLDRPNLGSNTLGLQAKLNYYPSPILKKRKIYHRIPKIKPDFYLDMTAGWEGKALQEEWNYNQSLSNDNPNFRTAHYRIRSQWNTSLAGMFRYNLKYASGIAVDYSYITYTDAIQRTLDKTNVHGHHPNPHVLGVSLRHEVFYKQMSMAVSLGAYPYRHMGVVNKHLIYETVGLRHHPKHWHNFYISYNVKAHGMRADGLQLNLGYCILKRKNLY